MRVISILNSYITKNLVVALVMTIFISTFVGLIGVVSQFFRMASGAGSTAVLVSFVALNIPKLMCYTLPIGILVATVLTFNRMSADNEVTALRASGISLLQIISPVVLLAIMISALSWWLQFEVAPNYTARARMMAKNQAFQNPVMLLQPGKPFALSNLNILIGAKDGNTIEDVHIYMQDDEGKLARNITATHGKILVDPITQSTTLLLRDTVVGQANSKDPTQMDHFFASEFRFPLPNLTRAGNRRPVVLRRKYMDFKQLLAWVSMTTANGGKVADYRTEEFMIELHKRAAWSISPFTFILIAIPLGLQMARRETAAGLVGCVVVAALYYIPMVIFGETLKPKYHPEYFMWGLNLGVQILGIILLWRKR